MSPELADLSLLELFALELASHRQALEEHLLALETPPEPSRLEALMRAAHSIKGAARIVDLPQAVRLAHAMEDLFQAAQQGRIALTTGRVDALLAATDFFGRLSGSPAAEMPGLLNAWDQQAQDLCARLEDLRETDQPGNPGAPAASGRTDGPGHAPGVQTDTGGGDSNGHHPEDGVVRLSAGLLGRLMGLAGQTVVEASSLGRIARHLGSARRGFSDLGWLISSLRAQSRDPELRQDLSRALDQLGELARLHADQTASLEALNRRMETLSGRLYAGVLGSRMRPFGEGARHLPRLVRDLALELGKQARFVLEGARVTVDRDILDLLESPLTHLARNALDHGLEYPEERAALGKPEAGQLVLSARHVSGMLEIRLADDGRGIDPDLLRRRIAQRGLASPEVADRLELAELHEFLFLPGFSTAADLTHVSGRGVGLDAVRTMARQVGGSVRVESWPGKGTAFLLRLPVSRSVIRALVFAVSGEPYALPLARLDGVLSASWQEVSSVEGRQYLEHDGQALGLVPAWKLLGRPAAGAERPEVPAVLLAGDGARFALAVDELLGERDLVVHPLDQRLGKVPCVAAASILDDASPVLILDEADLSRAIQAALAGEGLPALTLARGAPREERREGPRSVLVVDDSITVREVERQLLSGRGYRTATAVDGVEGLAMARLGGFDLIVTDVDMPRMTGIELTRALKADPDLAATPVMIVSYKDRPEDRLAGLEAGADFYFSKSGFDGQAMLQAVADLIGEP